MVSGSGERFACCEGPRLGDGGSKGIPSSLVLDVVYIVQTAGEGWWGRGKNNNRPLRDRALRVPHRQNSVYLRMRL